VPTLILKPLVIAAVDVQHHPRQWTPLTPLAMHGAPGLALHQTGCLQRLFDPRERPTQVGRAMKELGVHMIPAYSPQALMHNL
jgi:hypothetical protein